MTNVTFDELTSQFEGIAELDEQRDALKEQSKMITMDINEQFKSFAEEKEIKVEDLKKTYKYWQKLQNAEDPNEVESDFFTMCSTIDLGLMNQEK